MIDLSFDNNFLILLKSLDKHLQESSFMFISLNEELSQKINQAQKRQYR